MVKITELKKGTCLLKISNIILISFIIALVPTAIIFLMENQIKYVFYIFAIFLSGLFVFIALKIEYKFFLDLSNSYRLADLISIVSSIGLLILILFNFQINFLTFSFSIIVSFFVPGWILLRLLGVAKRNFNLGQFVLSFVLSIGITSLIFTFGLQLESPLILSGLYVVISFLPIIKDKVTNSDSRQGFSIPRQNNKHNLFEVLVLVWILSFFIFIMLSLTTLTNDVPGQDITVHFLSSQQQLLTPDIYSEVYPWFHLSWASINFLSTPPSWMFESVIPFLSLMLILSFFVMSKTYLFDHDKRAHLIATIFFFVFSGFGWLYFLQTKLENFLIFDSYRLLISSHFATLWDIGFGQSFWLWYWFRPITVGMTIFLVLLYLMKQYDISSRNYVILCSLSILTLSQVHFPELIVFIILLPILGLLRPNIKVRLLLTFISLFIGLGSSAVITYVFRIFFNSEFQPNSLGLLPALAILTAVGFFLVLFTKRPKISFRFNSTYITSIVLFVYFVLLLYWFTGTDDFMYIQISKIFSVPPQFYPMLLGIVGFFAILGSIFIIKKHRDHPIIIFPIFFVLAIIFGRVITFLNANIIETNYWERRIIPFVFVSASMLAPLIILKILSYKERIGYRFEIKNLWKVVFISFLVLGGTLSMFLSIEEQILFTQKFALTDGEKKAKDPLDSADPYSTLLTVTKRSRDIARYAVFGQIIDSNRYELWSSKNPELPLEILSSLNSSSMIYLGEKDQQEIEDKYKNGYIASHFLKVAPIIDEYDEGKILQLPRLSSPSSNSDTVLVLPEHNDNYYYAYDVLSLGGYNYTVSLLTDINTIGKSNTVITPTEEVALKLMDYKEEYNLKFEKLIVLNLKGYGPLINVEDSVFKIHGITSAGIRTNNNEEILFPTNVGIPYVLIPNNFDVTAYYDAGIPLILHRAMPSYDIIYLNLFPIIQELNSGEEYTADTGDTGTTESTGESTDAKKNVQKEALKALERAKAAMAVDLGTETTEFTTDTGDAGTREDTRHLYPLLGKMFGLVDPKLPTYDLIKRNQFRHISGDYFTFKESIIQGELNLESSSGIITTNTTLIQINVDKNNTNLTDVTKIIPIHIEGLTVKSKEGKIKGGSGFYTNVRLNSSSVQIIGNPAIIKVVFNDESTKTISGNKIQIQLTETTMLIRQPHIVSSGTIKFLDFFAHGDVNRKTITEGLGIPYGHPDLLLDGKVAFTNKYADVLSYADDVLLEGSMNSSSPVYPYEEINNLVNLSQLNLPYVITIGVIFVLINVFIKYKKKIVSFLNFEP